MKRIQSVLFLSVLLFTGHTCVAQSSVEERLVNAVSKDDLTQTSHLLDSSGFNFRKTCFNELSLFQYSMLADSLLVFTWLLEKADTLTIKDLEVAASAGN